MVTKKTEIAKSIFTSGKLSGTKREKILLDTIAVHVVM